VEALAVVGAAPVAVAAFAGFLWLHFGTPIIWLTVQSDEWHRHATPVWQTLARLGHRLVAFPAFGSAEANLLLNLVPVVLCITIVLITIRQIPVSFFLYVVGLCYLSISAPINSSPELIESAGRFLSGPCRSFWFSHSGCKDIRFSDMRGSAQDSFCRLFCSRPSSRVAGWDEVPDLRAVRVSGQ
jgi:hypothetical protein